MWVKAILKENGRDTYCIARVMAVIAFLSYLCYGIYGVYTGHVDLVNYATGLMQVLLGCSALIGTKNLTQKN